MKEGRDLVKEALQDAKSLKEAAVERAKNELVESLAPAVRKLLETNLKTVNERGSKDAVEKSTKKKGDDNSGREQKIDYQNEEKDLTLEDALQELFPGGNIEEKTMPSSKKSTEDKKSKKSTMKESASASSKSESIEISESELRKVYEAALQTEVQVKKGFSDIVGGGELDQAHKETGIIDGAKTKQFADAEVPHKQKWIPEARQLQAMVQRGLAENKALRENLRKAVTMVETLGKKLHEVNLFNAKVLHVNKILNSGARLTKEQKTFVMESIDKARTISEVKMVFETIVGGITTQAQINESRNPRAPRANAQGARTTGTPKQNVLSESVDRANNQDKFSRTRELAGLVK